MSDDLDLRGIDQRHEPDPEFRAALERRIAAIVAGSDPGSVTGTRDIATIDLEPTRTKSGPRRRSRRVTHGVLAIAVAAAVVTTMVVISRDDTTSPADTPMPSPLEEPSPDEVAAASNESVYVPGSGATEVTATRSYVSLRRCELNGYPAPPCDGPEGWAYVTGSADSPGVHYGLLGVADDLVLSPLDDELFVASSASLSQDPPSAPSAWLIDSVTGQRGPLRWVDQPTTLDSAEQVVVFFPAPDPIPLSTYSGKRFLPRVVDRRDWTIRPLNVPDDASAKPAIHQPGSGRIWIATAPDEGDVGLAHTDDGGASWTDVELPESLHFTAEEVLAPGAVLAVAASGDHVAVTEAWGESVRPVFVSADAGETWDVVPFDAEGNGRRLYVIDEHVVLAVSWDAQLQDVFVSNSASDWSRLEEIEDLTTSEVNRALFNVGQRGVASLNRFETGQSIFSTDLSDWWPIPSLPDSSAGL